ncbi:maleylacetoacetate isomerase [Aquabacterium sp. A08]|uniref:maleylacetoacetate isomerase n=1 Tax=Aquabacterium sp. A08 TaxID=2718532 RepID=UPI0035301BFF
MKTPLSGQPVRSAVGHRLVPGIGVEHQETTLDHTPRPHPTPLADALDTSRRDWLRAMGGLGAVAALGVEEQYPTPALLPADAGGRQRVRALAAIVGCDVHPVNNRRILEYLRKTFGADEAAINAWCGTWIGAGFDAYEALLSADTQRGRFSFGDTPTLADCYLVPQVESARRFQVDLNRWPLIQQMEAACLALPAFADAAPGKQPDAA